MKIVVGVGCQQGGGPGELPNGQAWQGRPGVCVAAVGEAGQGQEGLAGVGGGQDQLGPHPRH